MATTTRTDGLKAVGVQVWEVTGITGAETTTPIYIAKHPDMSLTIDGTVGSPAATLVLQVCNDKRGDPNDADHASASWKTATDTTETDVSFSSVPANAIQILQHAMWARFSTSGGTNTSLNARLKISKK